MLDAKAIAQSTARIVKEHVAAVTRPLLERIEQLEQRPVSAGLTSDVVVLMIEEKIAALPPAAAAKVDAEEVAGLIAEQVEKAVAGLPVPQDGRSVTIDDVRPLVDNAVSDAVAALPPPEPGKDADPERVASLVAEHVERAVGALPKPRDGKSVEIADLEPFIAELVAKAVAAIPPAKPGKDGVGISESLIGRDGGLVLTLTDGRTLNPGTVVGKDLDPGQIAAMVKEAVDAIPRPRDGFSLNDFDITPMPDGRTIEMSFTSADGTKHTYELQFPVMIYRGVYVEGQEYAVGDVTTWGGSLWHAEKPTKGKPDGSDWKLIVKKGRDGKDAKPA